MKEWVDKILKSPMQGSSKDSTENSKIENNGEDDLIETLIIESINNNTKIENNRASKDRAFKEGILERLQELAEIDVFYRYGNLIFKEEAKFELDLLKNPALIYKIYPEIKKMNEKGNLDW